VQSGRLRAIAVTGEKRSPQLPDVPTVAESGVPGYVVTLWFGLFAPAGTPRDIVTRLNTETAKVLRSPDIGAKLTALGAEVAPNSPDEFARFVREEIARWAKVVKATGIKPE
jgi:tripartite-type tricarboxylate transporter receptor subunit TctC